MAARRADLASAALPVRRHSAALAQPTLVAANLDAYARMRCLHLGRQSLCILLGRRHDGHSASEAPGLTTLAGQKTHEQRRGRRVRHSNLDRPLFRARHIPILSGVISEHGRTLQNSRQIADPVVMQESTIALTTPRAWIGDPRLGTFVVYLDRKRAGALGPQGSLRLQCAAGVHRVTARQWWYMSRPFELDLAPDREVRLTVDIRRDGSLLRRILLLMMMPWRAVTVEVRPPAT